MSSHPSAAWPGSILCLSRGYCSPRHPAQAWRGTGLLSPCLFNFYAEYIMRNAGLEEVQAGIKISGRNINNLTWAWASVSFRESSSRCGPVRKRMLSCICHGPLWDHHPLSETGLQTHAPNCNLSPLLQAQTPLSLFIGRQCLAKEVLGLISKYAMVPLSNSFPEVC